MGANSLFTESHSSMQGSQGKLTQNAVCPLIIVKKGETELLMPTDFAEEKQIDFQPETIKIQEIL